MGRLITKVTFNDHSQWFELAQLSDFHSARLAQQLGLSPRQIQRYIKRHFALTPQQWLLRLRMARAAELISVMHSVKEVAYALKFSQVSSFCRQFKNHYGMTCSEYAAMIAGRRHVAARPSPDVSTFRWHPLADSSSAHPHKPAEAAVG